MKIPHVTAVLMKFMVLLASSASSQILCPYDSGSLRCDCDADSIKCSGIQSNSSEIQDILTRFSSVSHVVVEVSDLSFETRFRFENISINNLTLGYGLETLSPDFFYELGPSLVYLNLNNNSISHIDDQLFSTLSSLTTLFLDFNDLTEVQPSMFAGLINLKNLSVASNKLNGIDEESFANLTSLHTLVLSHNNFTNFRDVNIKSSSLVVLKLDGCSIGGPLSRDTFPGIYNIEELDLSHNKISEVKSHSLAALKVLQLLNLSHNAIESLQENAFFELSNLTKLDLKDNKISLVKRSSFSGLLNLRFLDLSRNRLKAFLCDYTTDLASLEFIKLEDNEIKVFTAGAFYYSPLLKKLILNGNNLECSCDLTDMAHYLIENSTMERKDWESVHCVVTTTMGYLLVIDYKNSKCMPGEPCRSHFITDDDEDYDYEYPDETAVLSTIMPRNASIATTLPTEVDTFNSSFTNPIASSTADNPSSKTEFFSESSSSVYHPANSTYEETTTNHYVSTDLETLIESLSSNDSSTTLDEVSFPSTGAHFSDDSNSTAFSKSTMVSDDDASKKTLPVSETTDSIVDSSPHSNIEISSSDVSISDHSTDSITSSKNIMDFKTSSESETPYSVATSTVVVRYEMPTTDESITETLSILEVTTPDTAELSVVSTSEIFYPSPDIASTSVPFSSTLYDIASTTTPKPSTGPGIKYVCDDVELPLNKSSLRIDSGIMKNFTYDGSTFCLKWTLGSSLPPKSRCILKYTFIKGVKSENLVCPEFPGDIKVWSKNENIYKFCLKVYGASIGGSCMNVVDKTSGSSTSPTTSHLSSSASTAVTENTETTKLVEPTTVLKHSDSPMHTTSSSSSAETPKHRLHDISSTTVSVIYPQRLDITSFEIYVNDSSFAYAKWTVKEALYKDICHLTLTVTTQYFEHDEGTFPCKGLTHKLQNVQEDEIFKLCLGIHHKLHDYSMICRYSLDAANVDVEASSHESNLKNSSSSLIPLVCLLVILLLVVIFIVYKNVFKKRQESERYDVRAEEKKLERVQFRTSSHDHSFPRSSYIAKENLDI